MMHSIKHSLSKAIHHGHLHHDHDDHHNNLQVHQKTASTPQPPTPLDILRYRYQYGANLGSVYVLEKWLFPSAFPSSCTDQQTSELEAVKAWVAENGIEATRIQFETRWRDLLGSLDWVWLVNQGHGL
jgi:hypothetical protein